MGKNQKGGTGKKNVRSPLGGEKLSFFGLTELETSKVVVETGS